MSEATMNLINAISSGNALDTEAAFNAAMAEKISKQLDDMRLNVAKSMFRVEDPVEQQEVEITNGPVEQEVQTEE